MALDIALCLDHSSYDTLSVAVAIATGAEGLITVADRIFAAAMRAHPDPGLADMLVLLREWGARTQR